MITAICKIIPLLTVVGGAAASSPKLKAQIEKIADATRVVATQSEIGDIAKMVYLDTLDGTHPSPESFPAYLRENLKTTNGVVRDTSKDLWGEGYRLTYDRNRRQLIVTSAGPDKVIGNSDDLRGQYPFTVF